MGSCIDRDNHQGTPEQAAAALPPGLQPDHISDKYDELRTHGTYAVEGEDFDDMLASILANYKLLDEVRNT